MKNRVKKQALSFAAAMAMVLGGGMQLYAADKIADTVYHNGKIYTIAETMQEAKDIANAKKADVVATLNGKIVFVGSEADAKAQGYLDAAKVNKIVDLRGKTMLPGFVDGHSHSELPLLAGEGMDCKIMQGVTTENLGLDGMSLAPIKDGDKADWKKHLSGLAGTLDVPWTWNSFAEYLDCLQAAKPPLNVSSYV